VIEKSLPWFNRSYDPKGIGETTFTFTDVDGKERTVEGAYPAVVDGNMGSILSQSLPIFENGKQVGEKVPESEEEAANLIFGLWLNVGDRGEFIEGFTERRIQTFEEHLEFLGLTEVNDDILDGPVYDGAKRAVIELAKGKLIEASQAFAETVATERQG